MREYICSLFKMVSFIMRVCIRVTFKNAFVCREGEYELWCPCMRGGVVVGSQGDGGCMRSIPDSEGVCC